MRGVSGHGDASDERLPISEIPQSRHVVRVAEQWFPTTGGLDAVMPDGQVVTRDGRLIHHDVARVRSLAEESREQLMAGPACPTRACGGRLPTRTRGPRALRGVGRRPRPRSEPGGTRARDARVA